MSTPTIQTEVIDLADVDHVREVVAKANRKAEKIGVAGYTITLGAEGHRDVLVPDPLWFAIEGRMKKIGEIATVEVSVIGEAPKYAGWTFVATLDWVGEDAVIRKVRGLDSIDTTDARDGLEPNGCDHCDTIRDRNNTYLLARTIDGLVVEWKQVGSTCLRDFLGVEVNLSLLGFNPYAGCDSTNRYTPDTYSTLAVLEHTQAVVRAFGWVSGGQAYDDHTKTATRERLSAAYSREPDTYKGQETSAGAVRRAIREQAQDGDVERAREILAWIRSEAVGTSEYALNLKAAVGSAPQVRKVNDPLTGVSEVEVEVEEFQFRHLGIVISTVTGYQRWTEKAEARKAEAKVPSLNEWFGVEKERLRNLRLTVASTRWLEDKGWGSSLLVILRDEAGHTFKWFASNAPEALETTGAQVVLDGTVKAHETYNERKSTVLTRCSVKEVVTV